MRLYLIRKVLAKQQCHRLRGWRQTLRSLQAIICILLGRVKEGMAPIDERAVTVADYDFHEFTDPEYGKQCSWTTLDLGEHWTVYEYGDSSY